MACIMEMEMEAVDFELEDNDRIDEDEAWIMNAIWH